MNRQMIRQAVELAERVGHVFVATVDLQGSPHIAAAARMTQTAGGVAVEGWFCPGTVTNLQHSRQIALVAWDAQGDEGFQLLGQVEAVQDVSIMDGYDPQVEQSPPPPQVDRRLIVRVDRVLEFTHAPHSDVEV